MNKDTEVSEGKMNNNNKNKNEQALKKKNILLDN